jgi:hypothetical protein
MMSSVGCREKSGNVQVLAHRSHREGKKSSCETGHGMLNNGHCSARVLYRGLLRMLGSELFGHELGDNIWFIDIRGVVNVARLIERSARFLSRCDDDASHNEPTAAWRTTSRENFVEGCSSRVAGNNNVGGLGTTNGVPWIVSDETVRCRVIGETQIQAIGMWTRTNTHQSQLPAIPSPSGYDSSEEQ